MLHIHNKQMDEIKIFIKSKKIKKYVKMTKQYKLFHKMQLLNIFLNNKSRCLKVN